MKKQKRRAEPFSLSRALGAAGRTEEVQKLLYGKPALHIDCTGNISIENCREILQYNEDELLLDMGICRVAFKGDGILVDTYQKDRITAHGRVISVSFHGKDEVSGQ